MALGAAASSFRGLVLSASDLSQVLEPIPRAQKPLRKTSFAFASFAYNTSICTWYQSSKFEEYMCTFHLAGYEICFHFSQKFTVFQVLALNKLIDFVNLLFRANTYIYMCQSGFSYLYNTDIFLRTSRINTHSILSYFMTR